jgi:hypothetical protein
MCIIVLTDDGLSNRPKRVVEIKSIFFTYLAVVFFSEHNNLFSSLNGT